MKWQTGSTDVFMDPISGMITIYSFPDLSKDYVWYGNKVNRPQPSPIIKDIRIELRQFKANVADTNFIIQHPSSIVPNAQVLDELIPGMLRQDDGVISIQHLTHNKIWVGNEDDYPEESDIIPFSALPDLTYQYLWRGDFSNRPEEIKRIDLYNLPAFLTADPLNNFGLYNLYTGGLQLDLLEPIAPTTTQRIDMSNLPNLQEDYLWMGVINYTPPVIKIDAIPPFVHVVGSLNWDPAGLLLPSHAVPTAVEKIKLKNLPDLPEKNIWIGSITNRPFAALHIYIDNLPNLTFNKVWIGDVTNRPIESELPIEALPDLSYTKLWTGDITNRPIEVQQIIIDNLPDLTNGRLWLGNIDNRPVITQTIQIDNLPNLTYLHLWQGDEDDRPVEILEIDITNLPNLTNTRLWTGNGSNRPVETQTIIVDNLPNLSYKALWTGDPTDRPVETTVIGIYNMADLPNTYVWVGNSLNRPEAVQTIQIGNLPNLTNNKFWRGDAGNRPIEVTMTGSAGITVTHGVGNTNISGQELQDQIDDINTEIDGINAEIDSINSQISAINSHLSTIDTHLTTIDGEILTLQGQVTVLEGAVAALQTEVATLTTALADLTAVVAGLTTGVAGLSAQINAPLIGISPRLQIVEIDVVYLKDHIKGLADISNAGSTGIVVLTADNVYATRTLLEGSAITIINDNGVAGDITISVSDNPIFSGTAGTTLPKGTTAQRGGGSGTIRFNTTTSFFEGTADGSSWLPFNTAGGTVSSVGISGGSGGITVTGSPITTSGTIDLQLDLDLIEIGSLSGVGFLARIGDPDWILRTIEAGTGIDITNVDGVGGNPVISITNTGVTPGSYTSANITVDSQGRITAASNGPGSGTVTSVDISTSSSGVTVGGGPITSSGTLTVNINNELQALSGLSSNGYIVRTGSATYTNRSITGTANQITVSNGDGVGTNTNIAIANNAVFPGTEGVTLPNGTTAQRPGSPNIGEIRFNTTTNRLEAYY